MTTKIEFEFSGEKNEGILIKEDDKFLTIKLKSGYNGVFEKKNVKILTTQEIDSKKVISKDSSPKESPKNLPKIAILHTGGTIASKVDYRTGAVSSKFTPEELLNLYPELKGKVQIDAKLIGNLFSEDMRFAHYNLMLKEIENALKQNPIGIIISHGTDTMHYTSSALQYSCQNLPIPIILVGAQRSSDRPSSDAYTNLDATIDFLIENSKSEKSFRRVGILMHLTSSDGNYQILDGLNAKKMHSSRRDAFKQINYTPFAELTSGKLKILRKELLVAKPKQKFTYTPYDETLKLGFFKAHPNLFPEELKNLAIYDGVIIEGTGLGHLGINEVDANTKIHKDNLEELKKIAKKIPLVMGVQTIYGQTNMNVYSSGRDIMQTGVLGNYLNLTTETLFCRLAYCLSKDKKNFAKTWAENLEGFEIRGEDIEDKYLSGLK